MSAGNFGIPNIYYRYKLILNTNGEYALYGGFAAYDLPGDPLLSGRLSALATGGALATGKVGIYDAHITSSATTRTFDNFLVTVPTADAAIYASQSAELSTGALLRKDSGGNAYGPISEPHSDLPRLPPSGMDGRSIELTVKASRGNLDSSADSAIDDISARAHYRPSWLYVPD